MKAYRSFLRRLAASGSQADVVMLDTDVVRIWHIRAPWGRVGADGCVFAAGGRSAGGRRGRAQVVIGDVGEIFQGEFDYGLTARGNPSMPVNGGSVPRPSSLRGMSGGAVDGDFAC